MRKRFFLHSQHICQLQLNDLAMPTDKEISERIRDLTDQGVCKAKSVKAIIDSSNNIPSQRFSPSLERISALIQYNQNRYCQLKFLLLHCISIILCTRMYLCMYVRIFMDMHHQGVKTPGIKYSSGKFFIKCRCGSQPSEHLQSSPLNLKSN